MISPPHGGAVFGGTADRPQAAVAGAGVRRHDAGGAGAAAAGGGAEPLSGGHRAGARRGVFLRPDGAGGQAAEGHAAASHCADPGDRRGDDAVAAGGFPCFGQRWAVGDAGDARRVAHRPDVRVDVRCAAEAAHQPDRLAVVYLPDRRHVGGSPGVWPPAVGMATAGDGDHPAGGGGHEPAGRAASATAAGLGRPARRLMLSSVFSAGAIKWCG